MQTIDQEIERLAAQLDQPQEPENNNFCTRSQLLKLASSRNWGEDEHQVLGFIAKKVDVQKRLYLDYQTSTGKKVGTKLLSDTSYLELSTLLLARSLLISIENADVAGSLARFNTLCKSMDIATPALLSGQEQTFSEIESAVASLLSTSKEESGLATIDLAFKQHEKKGGLKSIPLTVLFYEGPIARAYLATIKSLGLKPQKIIQLVAAKDIVTKKKVGKLLPKNLRAPYAANIQKNKIHYWPKQLGKTFAELSNDISTEVAAKLNFCSSTLENAHALEPLTTYCDNVEALLVDGLNDQQLYHHLEQEPEGAILFTGGGIVPSKLLDLPHLKLLHIHPGHLPNIRGADCTLWSSLISGHTSATCFYMDSGIDTGNIISAEWLPQFKFCSRIATEAGATQLYRAVYSFLDPWVRSVVLRNVLRDHATFADLNSVRQEADSGETYYFMHEKIKKIALKNIFGH